ncbi:hypothetical protein [Ruegeria sp.]|uniref:hypothetical protein n=1 Tax=Ruegeria sp. TaxID=1879320 RepID=UPI003B5AC3A6
MRHISQISLLLSVAFGTSSLAETAETDNWFQMLDACETIVFDQDVSVFDGLESAEPLVNVGGLHEVAVFNPNASLVASAVSSQGSWFMCVIAANPALEPRLAGSLVQAWSETQNQVAQSAENNLVNFNDKTTFNPVRVRCGENERLVVAAAFAYENREFRMAITDRLPSSVENPCLH